MSKLTKSPVTVATRALGAGTLALRRYAHPFSPKKFTQPQWFACLALQVFFKTDYRGVTQSLRDLADLRRAWALDHVPPFTTLPKAARRLLARRRVHRLLSSTVRRLRGRRRRVQLAAFDSPGPECGRRRPSYVRRRSQRDSEPQNIRDSRFAKLAAVFECGTHRLIAAIPRPDTDRFVPLREAALRRVQRTTALADAGDDSGGNHRHARQGRGVRSVVPAALGRPSAKPPAGRYRRLRKRRRNKESCRYGQRWQAETGFSMIKRRLGSYVRGHSYGSQGRDLMIRSIT